MYYKNCCTMIFALVILILSTNASMAQCTLPYVLTDGQPLDATKVMANFNALISCYNLGGSANAIQYKSATGGLSGVGPLADGQIVVGATGGPPQAQKLTAGAGITITGGPGNITVAATPSYAGGGLYRQVMSGLPTAVSTGLASWINQGSATFSEGSSGVSISAPAGGDALVLRYGAAPAPPYTLTVLLGVTRVSTQYSEAGIGWYDGTSKLHFMSFVTPNYTSGAYLQVSKWSAYNFRVGYEATSANSYFPQPIWMQLKDDGTNITFAFSQDGANFLPLFTAAKSSAYLGPSGYTNFILFVNPRNGRTTATAMSWVVN